MLRTEVGSRAGERSKNGVWGWIRTSVRATQCVVGLAGARAPQREMEKGRQDEMLRVQLEWGEKGGRVCGAPVGVREREEREERASGLSWRG